MDLSLVTTVGSLLLALSVAAERLVEIVKGMVPALDQPHADPTREGWRRVALHVLAVGAGIVTTVLAGPMVPTEIYGSTTWPGTVALGLLASGGSGFWNSALGWIGAVKDMRKAETAERKLAQSVPFGAHRNLDLGDEQVTSNECYDVKDA